MFSRIKAINIIVVILATIIVLSMSVLNTCRDFNGECAVLFSITGATESTFTTAEFIFYTRILFDLGTIIGLNSIFELILLNRKVKSKTLTILIKVILYSTYFGMSFMHSYYASKIQFDFVLNNDLLSSLLSNNWLMFVLANFFGVATIIPVIVLLAQCFLFAKNKEYKVVFNEFKVGFKFVSKCFKKLFKFVVQLSLDFLDYVNVLKVLNYLFIRQAIVALLIATTIYLKIFISFF